jgi:AcrR family transcriptional regulator
VSRETVLGAAREAFAERGYDGTTLAAIGARLGVSPAALMRHAPSKEALFQASLDPTSIPGGGPLEFLQSVDPRSDPRDVLRRVAHAFIPFVQRKLSEDFVHFLHVREKEPHFRASGPRKVLGTLSAYLRRATEAGALAVRDPEASAMSFLGSLQSYVFLHSVLRVFDPPFPLQRYLENLLDIWTHGVLTKKKKRAT